MNLDSNKGIDIDGELINHLRFADDIIMVAKNAEDLEGKQQQLADESKHYGLKMNITKTKVMFGSITKTKVMVRSRTPKRKINVNNSKMETVEEYIYLGQRFNLMVKTIEKEYIEG